MSEHRFAGTRRLVLASLLATAAATAAFAQVSPVSFQESAVPKQAYKARKNVAVTAYHINFITVHEANSIANVEARARLNWVLTGVPLDAMKKLTNEAHADLKAKLAAAGVPVLPDDQARALANGVELLPGNRDIKGAHSMITLGQQVKHGWATFGADAAPAIAGFHNPGSPQGMAAGYGLAALQLNSKIGANAKAADALVLMPNLTIDFADMEATKGRTLAGGTRASAAGKVNFAVRAPSAANMVIAMDRGAPFGSALRMKSDATSATPFATVATGEAAVRELSLGGVDAYGNSGVRGDAIKVDLPAWEGLVRKAFQDYNTALVASIVKGRA